MMKAYLFLAVFFASHLMAVGELSKKELKRLNDVEIGGIRTDTWKNSKHKKFARLEVNTSQNEDDPDDYDMTNFRMRLIVELTDRQKQTYLIRFTGKAPEDYDSEYQGEDYWQLLMAYGAFDRLKITAYAVQYGLMDGETFIPLAEDEDDSEEMRVRVQEGKTILFPGQVYLRHYYMYKDSNDEISESIPQNIRAVKE